MKKSSKNRLTPQQQSLSPATTSLIKLPGPFAVPAHFPEKSFMKPGKWQKGYGEDTEAAEF